MWSRQIKFFETFGKYSLAIFTIHPFVIQALNRVHSWSSITDGLIKFFLVVIITYAIVRVVYFFKINKILYPH
jgi:fucose 4-O-acetylase-like acetyltransferase